MESPDFDRPSRHSVHLLQAAACLAGDGAPLHYFRGKDGQVGLQRTLQVERLRLLPPLEQLHGERIADGGEHRVYFDRSTSEVLKIGLDGGFGFIVDEASLLDSRTLLNRNLLRHRRALPSEYLWRWALQDIFFGLCTHLLGVVSTDHEVPSLVIAQPFIGKEDPAFPTTPGWDEVEAFLVANGFARIDNSAIADPTLQDGAWYRQRDGVIISDAFPKNFRLSAEGYVIPIDLVINVVPPGGSALLPAPEVPFQLPKF